MQKPLRIYLLLLLFLGGSGNALLSQDQQPHSFWDQVQYYYGTDQQLVNGRIYTPKRPKATHHPYFLQEDWISGKLFWRGQQFSNVLLKYNIEDNQLLLKQQLQDGYSVQIILDEVFVDSFEINNHLFIPRQNALGFSDDRPGYVESIHYKGFKAYRQHQKVFIASYSDRHPHGKYSNSLHDFFFYQNQQLHKINSNKAFATLFGTKKQALKKYLRQQKIKLKTDRPEVLTELLKYCHEAL